MFFQSINFVEISNHAFKKTRDYNEHVKQKHFRQI